MKPRLYPTLVLLLIAGPRLSAQCPVNDTTICSATIAANTIEVTGSQTLSGSGQCYHVASGGSLDLTGAYCLVMVEDGGAVNANGTGNLVLAKRSSASAVAVTPTT